MLRDAQVQHDCRDRQAEAFMSRVAIVLVVALVSGGEHAASTDSLRDTFLRRLDSYVALHRVWRSRCRLKP